MSDEPVRILRVIARLNVGGPALHVTYLSAELDKLGYETVLAAGRVGQGEGSMEGVAAAYGVEPRYIGGLQRDIEPWKDAVAIRRLLAIMNEFRPHILHTHTAKAGALGRTAARLAGPARPVAVVHTYHGHVLRGYFNPAVSAGFTQVERRLAAVTDMLIAVSPEVRDDLIRLGIAPADRIEVLRLGLDLDARIAAPPGAREVERTAMGVGDDTLLIGWLGRMTEIKRVDDLVQAFARLRRQGLDAHLVLAGDGPLRPSLEELASSLGIASSVHFLGFRDDVGSLYRAFDVVALSSANEGTPVTLIEALAAGVPAVATDVGGVKDVVEDGRTGILVDAGDTEAIAEGLARLATAPDLRAAMGREARVSVRDRYSVPRLVSDMDALYRRVLTQDTAAGRARMSGVHPLKPAFPSSVGARVEAAERKLRVIIVSQYFPPEIGATQLRMQAFAEYLALRGHAVTVITEFPNHPHGIVPDAYRHRLYEDDRSNPYRVLRVWVKTGTVKNQATRLAFYSSFTAAAAAIGPLAGPADVVLATTPPLFTGLAGVALARAKRAPLVLDVRDLWPAAAEALGQIGGRMVVPAAGALERWLYRRSDVVVAVTRPFCGHIDAFRRRSTPAVLIPNGTLDMFFAEVDGDSRRELGVPDDAFLVTFAGTHGIAQSLPTVLDAAGRVDGDIHFAFVGDGPVKQALEQDARDRALANVHFHTQVPPGEIPAILASSDALLVTLSGHPTFRDFVPSKMIDFMAAGRPVVLSAAGESARLLEAAGAGVVVAPDDAPALAEAISWLREHRETGREMGLHGRAWARRRLRSVQAERLEHVLLDACKRRRG